MPPALSTGLRRALNSIPPSYRDDETSVDLLTALHSATSKHNLVAAWSTYQEILHNHPLGSRLIPGRLLHTLFARLCEPRPRTRQTFLRMVSVLSEIRATGHHVRQWEWNALIHAAGTGFRRTTVEDYEAALGTVYDMMADVVKVDATHSNPNTEAYSSNHRPDIVTINTLLAIASRTGSKRALKRTLDLLESRADLAPDRITHLILLNQCGRSGQLEGVMEHARHLMLSEGGLGTDGVNAMIWAYGHNGRLDYALRLYERLHHAAFIPPPGLRITPPAFNLIEENQHSIFSIPNIDHTLSSIVPDHITYTALLQCMSYHGDFMGAIAIFRDLVAAESSPLNHSDNSSANKSPRYIPPTAETYRALFLGFTRFGVNTESNVGFHFTSSRRRHPTRLWSTVHDHTFPIPTHPPRPPRLDIVSHESYSAWTASNLSIIFNEFLDLPLFHHASRTARRQDEKDPELAPSSVIYWALVAFARTTDNDKGAMREAWHRMTRSFDLGVCGSLSAGSASSDKWESPSSYSDSHSTIRKWRPRGRLKRLVEWIEEDDTTTGS